MKQLTILDAIEDVFADWFRNQATWQPWFAFLTALFALPMNEQQLALYRQCTGRMQPPSQPVNEAWLVIGRRGGKSFTLALIAAYLACFHEYRAFLNRGERGTIMVIAQDRRQARVIMRFIREFLQVPMLARMVQRAASDGFDLNNQITIEIHVASFRSTRGYTIVAALCDEIARWPTDDSADPDFEVLNALRPGMVTIPNAMLLCSSSPYVRKGAMWEAYKKHHGKEHDPVLVWQAETRQMNPTVPQATIDRALEEDPAKNSAEYLAQFRSDIEGFVQREVIEACTVVGVYEWPYQPHHRYVAFVDPSAGGPDSFTLAIAHQEDEQTIVDCIREIRGSPIPFSPEAAVAELVPVCNSYRIHKVVGDRFAGEFPRELFRKHGVTYEVIGKPKHQLYADLLPVLNSKRVSLLDEPRLQSQLLGLERRYGKIDHPPRGHDDVANAVAGAVVLAHAARGQGIRVGTISGPAGGRITWRSPEKERPRVRVVKGPGANSSCFARNRLINKRRTS